MWVRRCEESQNGPATPAMSFTTSPQKPWERKYLTHSTDSEFKELLKATQLLKRYHGYQIWSCLFQIPSLLIPLSCISAEESFFTWPRCYSVEVLSVPSIGEREWQQYPEDGWRGSWSLWPGLSEFTATTYQKARHMPVPWSEQVPILSCYKPRLEQNTVGPEKYQTERRYALGIVLNHFYSRSRFLCLINSLIHWEIRQPCFSFLPFSDYYIYVYIQRCVHTHLWGALSFCELSFFKNWNVIITFPPPTIYTNY